MHRTLIRWGLFNLLDPFTTEGKGRPSLSDEKIESIREMFEVGFTRGEIMDELEVSLSSVDKYKMLKK